ncbi:MAG TPA: NAD(+) synthase [Ornithinibacter sp.]|jgi:NAD+ synthase (glutamine-hydrolysing)|uniref:NAD(+) synthase n=1 Tax=Ornithinibacter sp. TaxID=2862748 RepID=UPI001B629E59|nr:NAD(+) synthase [Ornithinibacter sp.]MBP6525034.1 NAD(+) synthase [Dermatophilaceae bacterium]HQV83178.1 NAD(+) synthase [Ornithinibacter sp.]HQW74401.1 NAD(+) synthase [Ornithinibacter sp.]HQX87490.1 NAD(+) synthase [Ornithinibacter sp.]HQZ10315.1 NAD(+) synthase [Ornithinibacter sp.]
MDFRNIYAQGFARVASCTVPVALADAATNAERIIQQVKACHDDGVAVALFPELSLSGYAIDDLLLQDVLLEAVDEAVVTIAEATAKLLPLVVVGAPVRHGNRLYNCGIVLHRGEILGVSPKSFLPNYREFYEKRHFASGAGHQGEFLVRPHWPGADADGEIPFGPDLLFTADDHPDLAVHVEICEDMWVPVPPSHEAALAGATVLLNLSASPITVGRAEDRHLLARSASARCLAAYLYAAASDGESTTDLSWDGMTMVYEMGDLLGESDRFPDGPRRTVVDVDLDRLRQERIRQGSFHDNAEAYAADQGGFRVVPFTLRPPSGDLGLRRAVDRFPFVPDDEARLAQDCYEAYNIQVSGLEQRMRAIGGGDPARMPKIVIGVSGGLDSTHALIVAAKACDRLGLPRTHIIGFTMPGFATSAGTKSNAIHLMESLEITWEELDIRPAATQMLEDLGHPFGRGEEVYDVTFENVQAGLRTDYLFRAANQRGGIVLGTGDLSELALGWCTYGVGDQMSHYGVNAGVPKTLMQHLIRWVVSSQQFEGPVNGTLLAILDQEISPELVPAKEGERIQSTEDSVGPYALQDFTLFHVLRRGYRPSKIAFLAEHAWSDAGSGLWPSGYPEGARPAYDLATIRRWMRTFHWRFFANQFKRSAIPNGPKVVSGGSLSPRGDWRMPSDAGSGPWLAELEANVPEA